ncbi:unnamed protein product [Brugia timori]|uniref:Mobile element protein n=1 Tax=Brugia timori TaxID=42155 RepID=A0A0R3QZL6_9BILA|nr:unnamed protein product [Brugia timori]
MGLYARIRTVIIVSDACVERGKKESRLLTWLKAINTSAVVGSQ